VVSAIAHLKQDKLKEDTTGHKNKKKTNELQTRNEELIKKMKAIKCWDCEHFVLHMT